MSIVDLKLNYAVAAIAFAEVVLDQGSRAAGKRSPDDETLVMSAGSELLALRRECERDRIEQDFTSLAESLRQLVIWHRVHGFDPEDVAQLRLRAGHVRLWYVSWRDSRVNPSERAGPGEAADVRI